MSEELTEKEHHLYGGSTAKHWRKCYGWASLVSQLPSEPAGEAADKGTALHKGILERKCVSKISELRTGQAPAVRYDDIPNWPGKEGELMAEHFWETLYTKPLEKILTGKQILIEKKLMLFPDKDSGGTADVVILYHDDKGKLVGVIGDLKTGRTRVEPSEEQLLFYCAALQVAVRGKGKEVDVFKTFIYQPEHYEVYTEHTFTKKEVEKAIKAYEKAIFESKKPKPKFTVGDHCTWCKGKAVCKAFDKKQKEKTEMMLQDNALAKIPMLSDEELLKAYQVMEFLDGYSSALNKYLISRFQNNNPVAGFKVIEGVSKRKMVDTPETIAKLKELKVDPFETSLIGVGETETRLKLAGFKKAEIDAIMAGLTTRSTPSPKITLIDDPSPPMQLKTGGSLLLESDAPAIVVTSQTDVQEVTMDLLGMDLGSPSVPKEVKPVETAVDELLSL